MSHHSARIDWSLSGTDFGYEAYNREHTWTFDGGVTVPASAAPDFLGRPGHVDPEAALVAALSSCHMLTFLALCAKKRLTVTAYRDEAVGVLEKNAAGNPAVTRVNLFPVVTFSGGDPDDETFRKIHDQAHEHCFIANSVTCELSTEPRIENT